MPTRSKNHSSADSKTKYVTDTKVLLVQAIPEEIELVIGRALHKHPCVYISIDRYMQICVYIVYTQSSHIDSSFLASDSVLLCVVTPVFDLVSWLLLDTQQ